MNSNHEAAVLSDESITLSSNSLSSIALIMLM